MKCPNCGKELKKIGKLTEEEIDEYSYIIKKMNAANQALKPNVVNGYNFTENQVFEYFRAAFDSMAQSEFLYYLFASQLKKRHGLNLNQEIYIDETDINNPNVYIHECN